MEQVARLAYAAFEGTNGGLPLFTYTFENATWAVAKHLAAGYLVYSIVERVRGRGLTVGTVVAVLVGSIGPDLIDKPLTWVGVLGYGRSFAHSLFTTTALLGVAFLLARRVDRSDLSVAFAAGYLSHILVDMFGEVFGSLPYVDTAFLFWPVIVKQPIGLDSPPLPVSKTTIFLVILVGAVMRWVLDGMVGVSDAVRLAREWSNSR